MNKASPDNLPASHALTDRVDFPLYVVTAAAPAPASPSAAESGSDRRRDDEGSGGRTIERSGCVAGFVTQCSIEPVRFLICISVVNHTYDVALRSGSLALHLLGAAQHELAHLFGEETGDTVDKFARCAWHDGATGAPVLDRCRAWIEGQVLQHAPVGDHEAFILSPAVGGPGGESKQLTMKAAAAIRAGHPIS